MIRSFNYGVITLQDIERNPHLIFRCDGDYKLVIVEREEENDKSSNITGEIS